MVHDCETVPWYVDKYAEEIDERQYYALFKAYTGSSSGRSAAGDSLAAIARTEDMALETALAENTAALKELTAAMKAGSGAKPAVAAAGKGGAATPAAAGKKGKHSKEDMQAALNDVKEKFGAGAAKEIISGTGGVEKMALIPEGKFDAVYDAAKAKMAEGEEGGGDEGDGL
jgi:hypothetical protein